MPTLKWGRAHDSITNVFFDTPVEAPFDPAKFTCWQQAGSTSILIASTAKLSEDIVNNFHVAFVPKGSQKISVLYSILVRQHALTVDAYEFLQKMKKNTEQTGSVFDAQPSELKGNIHCISNPTEVVLGFVSVCTEESKRIYIKNNQVPNWLYDSECRLDTVPVKGLDISQAFATGLVPVETIFKDPHTKLITKFFATRPGCVECTLHGSIPKPVFWPQ